MSTYERMPADIYAANRRAGHVYRHDTWRGRLLIHWLRLKERRDRLSRQADLAQGEWTMREFRRKQGLASA